MKRYNPDTGRQQSVPADSWEADNWSSRKPPKVSKARRRVERLLVRRAEQTVQRTLKKAARPEAAARAETIVRAIGTGVVGAAAIAFVAAGAAYILQDMPSLDPVVRMQRISMRYREARKDLAARLGRALTQGELEALTAAWRQAVAREQRATETERQRSIK